MKLIQLDKEMVKDQSYVKLARNKTHNGPVSEEKVARAKATALSAAANKVRVLADFTVKVKTDSETKENKKPDNKSWVFADNDGHLLDQSDVAEQALLLMQAWDQEYGNQGGSDTFIKKLTEANKARTLAYKTLGINPGSAKKPDLTSDQRLIYNQIVGPTGFDYFEYHLAFKLEGQKKFIRSKTYRTIRPMDMNNILTKLSSSVRKLNQKILISAKSMN